MGFRDLKIEDRYRSDEHNIPRDFLCPVLNQTVVYKRAVGYFSTSALVELSTGLFGMTRNPNAHIELICSPSLKAEDIDAINKGYKTRDEVFLKALEVSLTAPMDFYGEERLNLVATLVASGVLDIKIAFMEDDNGINTYHEKIAIFIDDDGNRIAYNGSMNESENGMIGNFESFFTFCSWKGGVTQTSIAESDFDRMWENKTDKIKVLPFPKIVLDKLKSYQSEKKKRNMDRLQYDFDELLKPPSAFELPKMEFRDCQKQAVVGWFRQECKGIFSMCTGAGKTIAALACMCTLGKSLDDNLAVFIVCPFIHLVSQWEEDVVSWGFDPIICHSQSEEKNWEERLRKSVRRFRNDKRPFVCITTVDTFAGAKMQPYVKLLTDENNVLFIADEAHNLGAPAFEQVMPTNFKYRIGLSATIERHMDSAGTKRLFDFFGEKCITYSLEQGIQDGVLVHYDYHPIVVSLDDDEYQKYDRLTTKLKKFVVLTEGKYKLSEAGKQIAFQRAALLAGARQKTDVVMSMMSEHRNDDSILIYCGASTSEDESTGAEVKQIDNITHLLRSRYGMSVQRFTAQEDLLTRQNIKRYFQTGQYQVVTAIRCLDEGVNIPGIRTAFILASSSNPKEFVQRRGRLLRKSENKKKAVIYDFVTLPRDIDDIRPDDYDSDRSVVINELIRLREFSKISDNPLEAESLMNQIMLNYGVYFDIDAKREEIEEYYG